MDIYERPRQEISAQAARWHRGSRRVENPGRVLSRESICTRIWPSDPLPMEVDYLERVTDPLVAQMLDLLPELRHSRSDLRHGDRRPWAYSGVARPPACLGADSSDGPDAALKSAGFRPRKFVLNPGPNEQDYQSAFRVPGRDRLRLPGRSLDLSKSRHDLRLEASAAIQTGRAAGCAGVLQLEQNRQASAADEGYARS